MERKCWESQGNLSVRKCGNHVCGLSEKKKKKIKKEMKKKRKKEKSSSESSDSSNLFSFYFIATMYVH